MKTRSLRGVLCISAVLTVLAVAAPSEVRAQDMGEKFKRGFCNMMFGIIEIPGQVTEMGRKHGAWGYPLGFLKGLVMVPCRTLVGVYELTTFYVPVPANYDPVLTPGTPFEYWEE